MTFDSRTINIVYEIPDYENDGYKALIVGKVDYNDIMKYLCVSGAAWKSNSEGKLVNFQYKYICYDVYPWYL